MNTKTVGYVAISNTINMWQVLNIKRDTSQNFKKPGFAIAAERIAVLARRKLLMNWLYASTSEHFVNWKYNLCRITNTKNNTSLLTQSLQNNTYLTMHLSSETTTTNDDHAKWSSFWYLDSQIQVIPLTDDIKISPSFELSLQSWTRNANCLRKPSWYFKISGIW